MCPAEPHHLDVLQSDPDVHEYEAAGERGGSVDSIDTLSSSADQSDSSGQTTHGAGGKDQTYVDLLLLYYKALISSHPETSGGFKLEGLVVH